VSDITQDKLRRGEPAALAALCARRGAAVLAYCEQVAGPERALAATCDAFAWFRVAACAPGELKARDAEALLRGMTRRAATAGEIQTAARRERGPRDERCAECERRLVYLVEDGVSEDERAQIEEHMAGCDACREALQRLKAAEHAYDHPPVASLALPIAEVVLGDLIAAFPIEAHGGDAGLVRAEALRRLSAPRQAAGQRHGEAEARPNVVATEHAVRRPAAPPAPAPERVRRSPATPPARRAPHGAASARARQPPSRRGNPQRGRAAQRRRSPAGLLRLLPHLGPLALNAVRRWRYKTALDQRRRPRWYNGRSAAWWVLIVLLGAILGLAVAAVASSAQPPPVRAHAGDGAQVAGAGSGGPTAAPTATVRPTRYGNATTGSPVRGWNATRLPRAAKTVAGVRRVEWPKDPPPRRSAANVAKM
jgi:hypothetical protein